MNGRYRIAWAGVLGWLLALAGLILAFTTTRPLNGATLAGAVLIIAGGCLVGSVLTTSRERGRHGR